MSGNQIPLQQVFLNTVAKMRQKIGLARQLMVDTETWRLYLHDGVTKGGHPLKKLDDPTEEIRTIPFRGPDPVAGETWVMGEWPSDEDPQVNERAYVAGIYAEHELTDEDIANATSQKGIVSGEQLASIGGGGGGSPWELVWSGSSAAPPLTVPRTNGLNLIFHTENTHNGTTENSHFSCYIPPDSIAAKGSMLGFVFYENWSSPNFLYAFYDALGSISFMIDGGNTVFRSVYMQEVVLP